MVVLGSGLEALIRIYAPKGLGDAIYLRAVTLHLLERGEAVTVFTPWPQLFADLDVIVKPRTELVYGGDLRRLATKGEIVCGDDFRARCINAGIAEPVALRMGWKLKNTALRDRILREAAGRKIFVYQPLKVTHNPEQELLQPRREAYERFIAAHAGCYRIRIGHPPFVQESSAPYELDLYGKAFIDDTFDVGLIGDIFFSEPCFVNVMAEAMDKQLICMFSARARDSESWVRLMTPARVFHKKHLATAVYDE